MAIQQIERRIEVGPELPLTVRCLHWSALVVGTLLVSNALTYYANETNMMLSDLVTGGLVCMLAVVGIATRAMWLKWPIGIVASWLFFAPLIFKTQHAVAYQTDTLAGALLVVLFWVLPTMRDRVLDATEIPPGWTYNPSSWQQRIPLIGLALIGFLISRYLAAYQLGFIDYAWDPWFGNGTEKTLTSEVSKAFVISDAGLGAVSYLIDALAGAIGGKSRWQTMPWMVLLFSFLVIPPGIVSIVLVMLQPMQVGAWCSLCLIAAVNMLIMVPLALDETVATCQYLSRAHRNGVSWVHAICYGARIYVDRSLAAQAPASFPGRSQNTLLAQPQEVKASPIPPLNLLISAAISAWVMAVPEVCQLRGDASTMCWLAGALAMTFAVAAFAEVCRTARILNIPLGALLASAPFWVNGFSEAGAYYAVASGIALLLLALPRGAVHHKYGSWSKWIK